MLRDTIFVYYSNQRGKRGKWWKCQIDFFPLFFTSVQDPDQDPDSIDLQDFGSLYPYPKKYADPRIWIKGSKYQPKTAKKTILLSNPKSELSKKERI